MVSVLHQIQYRVGIKFGNQTLGNTSCNQWVLTAKEAGFSKISITFIYFSIHLRLIPRFPFTCPPPQVIPVRTEWYLCHTIPLRALRPMWDGQRQAGRASIPLRFGQSSLTFYLLGLFITFHLKKGFCSFKMFYNHSSGPVSSLYMWDNEGPNWLHVLPNIIEKLKAELDQARRFPESHSFSVSCAPEASLARG